jgi:hypothetical protein
MSLLVSILVFLIVAGAVWWCAQQLIAAFSIPNPIATVITVVIILVILFAFLNMTGILPGGFGSGLSLRR